MKVGLLIIATSEYVRYLPQLIGSVRTCMLRGDQHEIQPFVFTDRQMNSRAIRSFPQEHWPWPHMTLRRYEIFWSHREALQEMDYLFYCDVDMTFVGLVGPEILGELVVTQHPGFYNKGRASFPYETNRQSRAFVPPGVGDAYYAGGFNGGTATEFLAMSHVLAERITDDLKRGIVAKWHDESHTNWYCACHKRPTLVLNPSYCFPMAKWAAQLPFDRKIVALDKRHAIMRK